MKICPQCQSMFDDESLFCVSDGTTLATHEVADPNRFVFTLEEPQPDNDVETRYVPIPQQSSPVASAPPASNWLYGVIGGLVAVILMGGGYLALSGSREIEQANVRVDNSKTSAGNTATNSNSSRGYTPVNTAVNTPVNTPASGPNVTFPASNAPAANVPRGNAGPERRFQRTYSGTIDNNGIAMDLERNGSTLTGKVRPQGRYAEIYVQGYIENDGSFQMDEKSDIGVVTGVYRGRINSDGTVVGTWTKPGGDKERSLFLRRQ